MRCVLIEVRLRLAETLILSNCRYLVLSWFACALCFAPTLWAEPGEWDWTIPTLSTALQGSKIEVRWTQPVRRAKASDAAQLTAYRVHFGPVSRGDEQEPSAFQYNSSFKIPADQTSVILDGFPPGKPYFVAVTALDTAGRESPYSSEHRLTIGSQLTAKFSARPQSGEAPLTVAFADQSKGGQTSRTWHFGDRRTSSAGRPRHTYHKPGTYRVRLEIAGPTGSDEAVRTITVSASKRSVKRSTAAGQKPPRKTAKRVRRKPQTTSATALNSSSGEPGKAASRPETGRMAKERAELSSPVRPAAMPLPGGGDHRGPYGFDFKLEDYGFTYAGAGDYRVVREAALAGDWFENRFGSVFHVTWIPAGVSSDQEVAYIEKSLWQTWRDIHPSLTVYLVRREVDSTPIRADGDRKVVRSFVSYTARVTGEKRAVDYTIRFAVFRGTEQTYACILSVPIGGSIFRPEEQRLLEQQQREMDVFFMNAVMKFRPRFRQQPFARSAGSQEPATVQALMESAKEGDTTGLQLLLRQGVGADTVGRHSRTPLMVAAGYGRTDTVQALVQAGAQVRAQSQWGATARIVAALNGHEAVVRKLDAASATQPR